MNTGQHTAPQQWTGPFASGRINGPRRARPRRAVGVLSVICGVAALLILAVGMVPLVFPDIAAIVGVDGLHDLIDPTLTFWLVLALVGLPAVTGLALSIVAIAGGDSKYGAAGATLFVAAGVACVCVLVPLLITLAVLALAHPV